jgi:hypothetical protein
MHAMQASPEPIAEHIQKVSHTYLVAYPEHAPRADDPYKHDFDAWKLRRRSSYYCDFAHDHRNGDMSECDTLHPLEAHHKIIELALMNSVDLSLLEADYPGISVQGIGKWIDNDENLQLLCITHHRSYAGVHMVSASDYGSSFYIRNMLRSR